VNKTLIAFLVFISINLFSQSITASPLILASGTDFWHQFFFVNVSADAGVNWHHEAFGNADGMSSVTCAADGETCVAFGDRSNNSPIVFLGRNKGLTWSLIDLPNLNATSKITGVECTGESNTATCFITGFISNSQNIYTEVPKLWLTTNAGATWVEPSINGFPVQGKLNGVSCTDKSANALCVAAGSTYMLVSQNGGKEWSVKNLPSSVTAADIDHISCTGHGSNAICVGVSFIKPSIVVSQDGGTSWKVKTIKNISNPVIRGLSCTGEAPTTVCIIDGYTQDSARKDSSTHSFMAVSNDNGDNWTINTSAITQFEGNLGPVSCVGNGGNAVCVITGRDNNNHYGFALSKDGAKTWSQHIFSDTGFFRGYELGDVHCQNKDSKVACVIRGFHLHYLSWTPIILSTPDVDAEVWQENLLYQSDETVYTNLAVIF
jgi:hypothetical protein